MTSLMNRIEQLIKREKTTPERKNKDDSKKSSNEILSELFGVFNADPPKIDDNASLKKAKKSRKKGKKDKRKRSRSNSSNSDSDYSHKRKKKKKAKTKKHKDVSRSRSRSSSGSRTPLLPVPNIRVKCESDQIKVKCESDHIKTENITSIVKNESLPTTPVRQEDSSTYDNINAGFDTSLIPMPEDIKLEADDLRHKIENKKNDGTLDAEKTKNKIQIKNLKFSTVFEETVKKAEEEARKKAEKYEEGEYTDSSNSSSKEDISISAFPKSSDPGGILKRLAAEELKLLESSKSNKKSKHGESSRKSSRKKRSRSKKRSSSRSKRSRSRSGTRRRRHRSTSRSRKRSRSRRRSSSKSKRRSRSRTRGRAHSPRHRSRRSRSPTGVKLADSEKKRLLEVARRNAINMLKNGAVPAGAAALPPHTRNQVMAAIQSGGKSVDELTDFCKHLSKKEALGELSSVSSNDDGMSENEDMIAFHHPFIVKEKPPIVMNIRGGAPLPIKSTTLPVANKEELRLQFPVSSGSQHREKASEWVPVSPKKDNMQVAKINSTKPAPKSATEPSKPSAPLAIEAPPPAEPQPAYLSSFTSGSQLSSVPALPAPGPQAYPPGIDPPDDDIASIVSQKLSVIRKEQEENELSPSTVGFGWSKDNSLGQFTGTTGANILTPRELASGTQAWAKKDQLVRAAPVEGGMGMHLLQKMGWTPGRGLGKEESGTLQPLLLEVKLDTRGLQAKEETPIRNKMIRGHRPHRNRGPAPLIAGGKHPVSLLGEYCSKHKLGPPEYSLCFECGPDHKKNFLFRVKVAGIEYQPAASSANKKQAKADAAQLALQKLGIFN